MGGKVAFTGNAAGIPSNSAWVARDIEALL
jgi:hypothetical protein